MLADISVPTPYTRNRAEYRYGSNTELSEFLALTEFRGESSVSSSQPIICVPKRTHRVLAELAEFAAELSEAQ